MSKEFVARIRIKEGYNYFIDEEGIVWGKKLKKGLRKSEAFKLMRKYKRI